MMLHELQDRLAEIAKKTGNIRVVGVDPRQPNTLEEGVVRFTDELGFVRMPAQTEDGVEHYVLAIIPNPGEASVHDADGNLVPLFGG